MAGLALIGALTWSQPDRDLKGGQSGNPFQIGSFFIYFQLGSRAPHTIFGFEKSDNFGNLINNLDEWGRPYGLDYLEGYELQSLMDCMVSLQES